MVAVVAGVGGDHDGGAAHPHPDPAAHDGARAGMREAARSFIPLRINTAGVMPIVFAQSIIVVPGAFAQFSGNATAQAIAELFSPGTLAVLRRCRRS